MILNEPLLKQAHKFSRKKKIKIYLVGGYIRDIFLKRRKDNPDIDLAVKHSAIKLARDFSRQIKAGFVVLDREHGCARVVKKADGKIYTIDFTDFRGKTLEEDLLHRDFTINSMAVDLDTRILIDPYGGLADIKKRTLRLVNKKSFDEDPLRILRAFSLSAIFGFKIDKETLKLARAKKDKLKKTSFERIRDELFKILGSDNTFDFFKQMDEFGILSKIIPEVDVMRRVNQGPYHHLDVFEHSMEAVRQIDKIFIDRRRNKTIQSYLNEDICAERKRRALLKFGVLLHDIGKPSSLRREKRKLIFHGHERAGSAITKDIALRLKLSNDEMYRLRNMVFWHLRPGYLADNEDITPRAIFRYFRDTGSEAVSVLLLSLADQRATRGRLTTKDSRSRHENLVASLIKEYFRRLAQKKPARLITGDDLIAKFKLQPSPLIGKILSEIEELQATDEVKTKKEALSAASKILKEQK